MTRQGEGPVARRGPVRMPSGDPAPGLSPLWADLTAAAVACGRCASLHLVGGPVRDLLLGHPLERCTDLDIVAEGDAPALAAELLRLRGGTVVVHAAFGTATWTRSEDSPRVDLASARKESYPLPGALPRVEASGLGDDLLRRDFSVNAIALRLWPEPRWELVDPLDGRADLEAGILRILHPRSFLDDPTRMLRAARFAARFGLQMDAGTSRALRSALSARCGGSRAFGAASGDRLRAEWELLCREPDPPSAVRWLAATGVAPALGLDAGRQHGLATLTRLWEAACRGAAPWDPELALAALLAGADCGSAAGALGLRGAHASRLARRAAIGALAPAVLRAADRSDLEDLLRSREPAERALLQAAFPETAERIVCYEVEIAGRPPLLDGNDLLAAGMAPGPAVGAALRRARKAQLLDGLDGKDAALAMLGLPAARDDAARPAEGGADAADAGPAKTEES